MVDTKMLSKLSIYIIVITLLLTFTGFIMVFSSSVANFQSTNINTAFITNQVQKGVLGVVVMLLVAYIFPSYKKIKIVSIIPVLISIALLIAVLIYGVRIKGAVRWIDLGFIAFQPSEVAKLALILYITDFVARKKDDIQDNIKKLIPPIALTLITTALIAVAPAMSAAFIVGFTSFAIIFIICDKFKFYHLPIPFIAILISVFVGAYAQPYRTERVRSFYFERENVSQENFQQHQASIALANGGFFRFALGSSRQKLSLPESHNDFIFAILGEEFGFFGAVVVLFLYVWLIFTGYNTFLHVRDPFGKYIAIGLTINIAIHSIMHLFVVLSLMPTTGIAMPFMSYGGSSLIVHLTSAGILLNILHSEKKIAKKIMQNEEDYEVLAA